MYVYTVYICTKSWYFPEWWMPLHSPHSCPGGFWAAGLRFSSLCLKRSKAHSIPADQRGGAPGRQHGRSIGRTACGGTSPRNPTQVESLAPRVDRQGTGWKGDSPLSRSFELPPHVTFCLLVSLDSFPFVSFPPQIIWFIWIWLMPVWFNVAYNRKKLYCVVCLNGQDYL